MTNLMRPEAKFTVNQCTRFSTDSRITHDQDVKRVLKYPKGTAMKGLIMKQDPEKGIKCYMDVKFSGGWNQKEGKDPGSVLSITGYIITYTNFNIIWNRRLKI